jgi:hypothetical protein
MSIRIVLRDNLNCPVVFCDHCQQEIETAKNGNYEWQMGEKDGSSLFFTHKACSMPFRQGHPEVNGFGGLTAFPFYLRNNLEVDPEEETKAVKLGNLL